MVHWDQVHPQAALRSGGANVTLTNALTHSEQRQQQQQAQGAVFVVVVVVVAILTALTLWF